jgi:hypothetical protein
VDCAIAPVEISAAAADMSSNFFIMFSLPLDATQRKPHHGVEVPEQG